MTGAGQDGKACRSQPTATFKLKTSGEPCQPDPRTNISTHTSHRASERMQLSATTMRNNREMALQRLSTGAGTCRTLLPVVTRPLPLLLKGSCSLKTLCAANPRNTLFVSQFHTNLVVEDPMRHCCTIQRYQLSQNSFTNQSLAHGRHHCCCCLLTHSHTHTHTHEESAHSSLLLHTTSSGWCSSQAMHIVSCFFWPPNAAAAAATAQASTAATTAVSGGNHITGINSKPFFMQ